MRSLPDLPPRMTTVAGNARCAGIDLAFAGVEPRAAAHLVQHLFGGRVEERDARRFQVPGSAFGTIVAEPAPERLPGGLDGGESGMPVATSIVAPLVPIDRLRDFEQLVAGLRAQGARGSESAPECSFGLTLSPDAAVLDVDYLLRCLRAYLLLSDWLRGQIAVDAAPAFCPDADPFPRNYALHILDPEYQPTQAQLIDDYIASNPTRNRELDLLPLFAELDEQRVWRAMADPRLEPRAAFRYRLPRARLGDPKWSAVLEWNRWVEVERLAEDSERLNKMSLAFRRNARREDRLGWLYKLADWFRR